MALMDSPAHAKVPAMFRPVLRVVPVLLALFVLGPIAYRATHALRAGDGSTDTSLLVTVSPIKGALAGLLALGLAGGLGLVVARLRGRDAAYACAGYVLAWAAWGHGSIEAIIRRAGDASPLSSLAVEGAVVGMLVVALAVVMARASRPPAPGHGAHPLVIAWRTEDSSRTESVKPLVVIALIVALASCGAASWLIAFSTLKGQTLLAGVVAGIAGAAAAQVVVSARHARIGPLIPLVAMAALAVAAPILTRIFGGTRIVDLAITAKIAPFGRLTPMDWGAGALLGVPIGLAWAESMLERPVYDAH